MSDSTDSFSEPAQVPARLQVLSFPERPADSVFERLKRRALEAWLGGQEVWEAMPEPDRIAVGLIINEPIWLSMDGYTLVEAIDALDPAWLSQLGRIEHALSEQIRVEGIVQPRREFKSLLPPRVELKRVED